MYHVVLTLLRSFLCKFQILASTLLRGSQIVQHVKSTSITQDVHRFGQHPSNMYMYAKQGQFLHDCVHANERKSQTTLTSVLTHSLKRDGMRKQNTKSLLTGFSMTITN